jgi:hypothetical protein
MDNPFLDTTGLILYDIDRTVANGLGRIPRHLMHMVCNPDADFIWRIEERNDGTVESMYIGFLPIDSGRVTHYNSGDDLPEWIKDRIAVLRMLPPKSTESVVFGVGRRIDTNIFWVVGEG